MADQGVEYEISLKDSTKPGVESAKATVSEGAKAASKNAEDVSNDFKGAFSPMGAITAALTGNFQAMGQQLVGLVSRLKNVHMSMMQFGLYAGLVMAVAKAAQGVVEYFRETARQAEQIKLDNAATSLNTMRDDSAMFAHNIEEARKNAEALAAALKGEVDAMQSLSKAQIEFAKAQELALAKSDKERQELLQLVADIETNELGISHRLNGKRNAGRTWWIGTDEAEEELSRLQHWGEVRDSAAQSMQDAEKRKQELERKLEAAERRRDMLDVKEEAAEYSDAAEMQTELNEAWQEADEAEKKEIEEIRELAVEAAEEVRDTRLKALAEEQKARMADLREATDAEAAAQQRLAAAKAQVDRAWGWYRNKDSLAAQLEEEKADAAAREQYEKDFDRLRRQRPDWEKAKNLSLDQEAVKRVALARREEDASKEAVAETAENTRRAADALENIEAAFNEGGE